MEQRGIDLVRRQLGVLRGLRCYSFCRELGALGNLWDSSPGFDPPKVLVMLVPWGERRDL